MLRRRRSPKTSSLTRLLCIGEWYRAPTEVSKTETVSGSVASNELRMSGRPETVMHRSSLIADTYSRADSPAICQIQRIFSQLLTKGTHLQPKLGDCFFCSMISYPEKYTAPRT